MTAQEPSASPPDSSRPPRLRPLRATSNLFTQQAWVCRLRWIAASLVLIGGLAESLWLHWYNTGLWISLVGLVIFAYNTLFIILSRHIARAPARNSDTLYALVWPQIVADLACLTILTLWTGAYDSPLRALFVCHMVFASLLLNRIRAFGVALAAIGMVETALLLFTPHAPSRTQLVAGLGWDITLLATVYLAARLSLSLRRQRRRLFRQNRRIRKMSRHLQQQQQLMIQQEKMIAMGGMAAGVAHEIGNPLASMDGLLQLLERRPEKAGSENFARLRTQVARINQIVRQLTAFSRPAPGEWRTANLNDVVNQALAVLNFDKRVQRIPVEKVFDPALPPIHMQPPALEQVVMNLVINAADAMAETAAPRLTLITQVRDSAVELIVRDNGQGILEKLQSRIFEPFFTTKPVGRGTGLGLSISYTLVQEHGGEIRVESVLGEGATFRVSLPIRQSAETPAASVHS